VKKYFALLVFILIVVSIASVILLLPRGSPVSVGPMIVSAGGSSKGCVTIVFESGELTLNGKKVTGELIVSFGGETHVIPIKDLSKAGRITVVFNEGSRREEEGMRALYSFLGVDVREGVSGKEIIKLLSKKDVGGIRLPTLTLALWLVDEEGSEYVISEAFTSVEYYFSQSLDYYIALEKAFQDPLAIVREGPTIIIPSIEKLREFLVRIDAGSTIEKLMEELGIENRERVIDLSAQDIIYVENYLQFPQSPPEFFRNRVRVLTPGVDEVWLENEAWQNFIRLYASAYLFRKTEFTTPEEVRDYLSSFFIGWCAREKYFENFNTILSTCLNPSSTYSVQWNHTIAPGTFFWFYKPYVITMISANQNLPPLELSLLYGVAEAGYVKRGFAFMGVLVFGSASYYLTQNVNGVVFSSYDWQQGIRHAALIVPALMQYRYDALFFKWVVRSYNQDYWVAIPVPVLTPYYEEVMQVVTEYWSVEYYDSSGNLVWGTYNYVGNIYALLYNVTSALDLSEGLVEDVTHDQIPLGAAIIDISRINNSPYYAESLASVMFSVFKNLVIALLGSLSGGATAKLFLFLCNFIEYADTTFHASAAQLLLKWRRIGAPQETPVRVTKITVVGLSPYYSQLGNIPLVTQYVVTIGQFSNSPLPCPPNDPACLLPENRTS